MGTWLKRLFGAHWHGKEVWGPGNGTLSYCCRWPWPLCRIPRMKVQSS